MATPEKRRSRGRIAGAVYFPRHSLKKALVVAETIWKDNGGEPYNRLMLAKSLNLSPTGSPFSILLASSYRYGLTEGSYVSEKISLTSLGRLIVAPTAGTNIAARLREALVFPPIFRDVFGRFDQKPIPKEDVFKNTLQIDFKIPKEDVDACYEVVMENMADYGLAQDIKGTKYLQLDLLAPLGKGEKTVSEEEAEVPQPEELPKARLIKEEEAPIPQEKVPWVFISHSKNKKILEQIKQMLSFGNFKYEIAEERETTAIPLSDKVLGLMRNCNCAIINISADEEKKQEDTYGINENVLIEVGGAFLHYDKRVILVIDKKLKDRLPSILDGLTAIFYEGDELSWNDGMRLQKALTEFRSSL